MIVFVSSECMCEAAGVKILVVVPKC